MSTVPNWLAWAPLAAALLHIAEEFIIPGGFASWYRQYRGSPSSITTRFLVIVNAALILGCLVIWKLRGTRTGAAYLLTFTAVMCSNGIWHLIATLRSQTYSPGVFTGVLVYVPLCVYGFATLVRSGAASVGTALIAALIGGSYHLWSALYHRRQPVITDPRS